MTEKIRIILSLTKTRNRFLILPGMLAALFLQGAPARSLEANSARPSAELLVDRAVERAESQRLAQAEAQFESWVSSLVESLDSDGSVTDSERARFRQYPIRGALYEELVEKDGRALTEQEVQEEKKKLRKFTRKVDQRIAKGKSRQPEDETKVLFDEEFVSRYEFELTGEDFVEDYSCWIVSFSPREGKLPVRRRMDEALNNSQGRIWIAKDDYGIVQVEFSLLKPIRYLWGFLATIRDTTGRIQFRQLESNVWLPSDFELTLDLRILVKSIRRRIHREWTEYRRIDPIEVEPRLAGFQPTR